MNSIIFGMRRNSCGLLLDMGLGKTRCAIDISRYKIQTEHIGNILVVTPTSIMNNWRREVQKWSEHQSIILHGDRKTRLEKIEYFLKNPKLTYGIINYEALHLFYNELMNLNLGLLIFDESARYIKNHLAKRTKSAIGLSDATNRALLLTGTPIANRPLDIWSQFRAMDGGQTFGKNFYRWRNRYFFQIKRPRYVDYYLKKETIEALKHGIYRSCIRYKKEDVLPDLPEKLWHKISLPLEGKTALAYNQMKEEVIAEVETIGGTSKFKINHILTRILRLQTITSGFIKNSDGMIHKLVETPKLDALVEEVETIVDVEESVVIWVKYLFTIDMIEEELRSRGIGVITMSGQDVDKDIKWRTFQKSENTPVFIGQIESGGFGTELFKLDSTAETQHMIFFENSRSLDTRDQALDRIHRIGQRSICRYVDIVVEGTIDEKIIKDIDGNRSIADSILEVGVKEWLGGD